MWIKCRAPKKEINEIEYRLVKEGWQVFKEPYDNKTWSLVATDMNLTPPRPKIPELPKDKCRIEYD